MRILHTNGDHPDFILLCHQLDQYLDHLAGGEQNRSQYTPYNTLEQIHNAFVAYLEDTAAGCASFREFAPGIVEVKRVFVLPEHRRRGVAQRLMAALEKGAHVQGYGTLILETGEQLVQAVKLYQELGFHKINNYGPYANIPTSICMAKEIVSQPAGTY